MSSRPALPALPISEVVPDIRRALSTQRELILEAPPGAGKTTLVPLALLEDAWLGSQRILMLEPRRVAARAAAQRMADLLGETVGDTVGFRVRQETRVGANTRIEVVTEGILSRMLLADPALSGIGLVIFDEFHERSLDADTGLALTLQGRELFRDDDEPLRVMLMSATLNGAALTRLLPEAPVIRSEGRQFPVTLHYGRAFRYDEDVVGRTVATVAEALDDHPGNVLVFLPGRGEIERARQQLTTRLSGDIDIYPLYGTLPPAHQQRAIAPSPDGRRKVVLATDIAETSLTIEGIAVVVDSGLCRQPTFDAGSGMTRLHTRRISQDASTQRAGRAGRLAAGHCYRLWSEEQQLQLTRHRSPEILHADLAPLLLQLLAWGVDDLQTLDWLDTPPPGPTRQALALLWRLGAIAPKDPDPGHVDPAGSPGLSTWRLTRHGEAMIKLSTHPRLAHMLLEGLTHDIAEPASAMAALLTERSPLLPEYGADLSLQLDVILGRQRGENRHRGWLQRARRQLRQFQSQLNTVDVSGGPDADGTHLPDGDIAGFLIACAYPERIARRTTQNAADYRLANGYIATLAGDDPLSRSSWLAIAEMGGVKQAGVSRQQHRIFAAASLDPDLFAHALAHRVDTVDVMEWDENRQRFMTERRTAVGKLVLHRQPLDNPAPETKTAALVQLVQRHGLDLLPWDNDLRQWQARVQLLHQTSATIRSGERLPWPDVSDDRLLDTIGAWLVPHLADINTLEDFQKLDLHAMLAGLLPWPLPNHLDQLAPRMMTAPSGCRHAIDYLADPPVLRIKLQEMFGCAETPTIINGQVPLMLHLLSPAGRPLQVTQDLGGFWKSSYFDVRREMKGRYPKHPWPDDPMTAEATRHTKRRR